LLEAHPFKGSVTWLHRVHTLLCYIQQVLLLLLPPPCCYCACTAQMATLDQANTTMYNFAAAAKRKAQAEINLISQFAAERGAELPLQPWDVKYWREQYKLATFKVDQAALREYLLVDNVLDGMFQVCYFRCQFCVIACYNMCSLSTDVPYCWATLQHAVCLPLMCLQHDYNTLFVVKVTIPHMQLQHPHPALLLCCRCRWQIVRTASRSCATQMPLHGTLKS
jgi:hypothetical protein